MKTLKSTLTILGLFLYTSIANAQSPFDKFYEKYATQDGYTSVNISKDLFQMFANMGGTNKSTDNQHMAKLVDQLNSLKVLTCKPDSLKAGKATIFYNEAVAIFNVPVW